jgi:DNA sulfur modification protein DndE
MSSRLITSKETKRILKEIQSRSNLRPNILARIAINLAIANDYKPSNEQYDSKGLEFHRDVLLGNYEQLFKSLISQQLNNKLTEKEFFPDILKLYLENGSTILESEYNFAGNYKSFFSNILKNDME